MRSVKINGYTIRLDQIVYVGPVLEYTQSSYFYFRIFLYKRENFIEIQVKYDSIYEYIKRRLEEAETENARKNIEDNRNEFYNQYKINKKLSCENLLKNLQKALDPHMITILPV